MLEKLPKMSARELMINLYGRPPAYGEQPRWLKKIADKIGLTPRMARSLWNDEIKDQNHWAIKRTRHQISLAKARKEADELAQRYQSIAGGMRAQDENFYGAEIDRLERIARIIGGLDSSGN